VRLMECSQRVHNRNDRIREHLSEAYSAIVFNHQPPPLLVGFRLAEPEPPKFTVRLTLRSRK
jgi:hypothetical protein